MKRRWDVRVDVVVVVDAGDGVVHLRRVLDARVHRGSRNVEVPAQFPPLALFDEEPAPSNVVPIRGSR